MPAFKKVFIVLVILFSIGALAKSYSEAKQQKIAIDKCGGEKNVEQFDYKGFKCKPL